MKSGLNGGMHALLAGAVLAVLMLPLSARAASLRCGPELVNEGDSRLELVQKCGEPSATEQRVSTQTRTVFDPVTYYPYPVVTQVLTEEWTYNFGPNRFMQVVVLENGVLVDVRAGPYGR